MSEDMNIGDMLADQLQRLLENRVTPDWLTALEKNAHISDLWQEVENLGLPLALAVGDAGANLIWQECLPVIRTLGWHGAPVPLLETMIAAQALSCAGMEIPTGAIALTTADYQLSADGSLHGEDPLVPWLPCCQWMLGVAVTADTGVQQLFLLPISELSPQSVNSIARVPSSAIKLEGYKNVTTAPIGSNTNLLEASALGRAALISGVLDRVLALVVEYANTRQQFGRAIGKFQAIQHHLAEIAMQTAAAQAAVIFGSQQMDADNSHRGAAIAKIRTGVAATKASASAHQVFGAIGITEEHELHLLTRRLWQWRSEAGSDHFWAEQLGQQVIAAGGDQVWAGIAAS